MTDIRVAAQTLEAFTKGSLRATIATIESDLRSCSGAACGSYLTEKLIGVDLLLAANALKKAAGQIHVIVHSAAILLLLPRLLEEHETVQSVSLGAGNAGKRGF